MKIRGMGRRFAAASLSFVMSFVFCLSGAVPVVAGTEGTSKAASVASPSSATRASASDAVKELLDEDGFLLDAELLNDLPEEAGTEPAAADNKGSETEAAPFRHTAIVSGYHIELSADEGVFPKGTTVQIEKTDLVNQDAIDEILQNKDTTESVVSAVSFDIRFMYEGDEIQPEDGTVSVSIRLTDEMDEIRQNQEDSQVRVFHAVDAEAVEEIACACDENSTVSYEAESFSTYTVAVTAPTDSIELSGECGEGVTWEVKNNTLTIKGSGKVTDSPWLTYTDVKTKVTAVVVEEGITELCSGSFAEMQALKNADIPESIKVIPATCFAKSGIKEINLPESIVEIMMGAFQYSELESIVLPNSLKYIGNDAFYNCKKLKSFRSGSGLLAIGSFTFNHCTALEQIILNDGLKTTGNKCFSDTGIREIEIPSSVTNESVPGGYSFPIYGDTNIFARSFKFEKVVNNSSLVYSLPTADYIVWRDADTQEVLLERVPAGTTAIATYHCNQIKLSSRSASLRLRESMTLSAEVLPENAVDKSLTWSSTNPEVASVDADGKVTGHRSGSATIIAMSNDRNVQAQCRVRVGTGSSDDDDSDSDDYAASIGKTDSNGRYLPDTYPDASWVRSEDGSWYLQRADGKNAAGWAAKDGAWYFMDPQTKKMATGWVYVQGLWYHLGFTGAMETGWIMIDGKWYYLFKNGSLAVNTTTPDGYYVNEKGEWIRPE